MCTSSMWCLCPWQLSHYLPMVSNYFVLLSPEDGLAFTRDHSSRHWWHSSSSTTFPWLPWHSPSKLFFYLWPLLPFCTWDPLSLSVLPMACPLGLNLQSLLMFSLENIVPYIFFSRTIFIILENFTHGYSEIWLHCFCPSNIPHSTPACPFLSYICIICVRLCAYMCGCVGVFVCIQLSTIVPPICTWVFWPSTGERET